MSAPADRRSRGLALTAATSREQGRRLVRTLRFGRPASQRPLPRVRIQGGPWVVGTVLRLAVAVVAIGCAALLATGPQSWALAIAAAGVLLLRPGGFAAGGFALGLGLALALSPAAPFAPRVFLLLFGVHLLFQLAALAGSVGWTTVVELRVLVPPLRRLLAGQVFAQLLALGGAELSSARLSVAWLPVLVGIALTGLAWRVLGGLARQ